MTVSSTTTPVSVAASTSAAGAGGSVIDVNSLVSQLVAATRAPKDSIISTRTQTATTQISAVGTLKSALSTFQTSLAALDTPGAFNTLTATSSSPTTLTASAGSSAVAGTYSVSVTQLATAQQLVSKPIAADGSSTVGTGTLKVSLGAASFNVALTSANDTVSGLAAAINSATGNPGVTATVITGTDGAHLILFEVENHPDHVVGERQELPGHGLFEPVDARDPVADFDDPADLLEIDLRLVARELALDDFADLSGLDHDWSFPLSRPA